MRPAGGDPTADQPEMRSERNADVTLISVHMVAQAIAGFWASRKRALRDLGANVSKPSVTFCPCV